MTNSPACPVSYDEVVCIPRHIAFGASTWIAVYLPPLFGILTHPYDFQCAIQHIASTCLGIDPL